MANEWVYFVWKDDPNHPTITLRKPRISGAETCVAIWADRLIGHSEEQSQR